MRGMNLPDAPTLDARHLRLLVALAQYGSVGQAAQRLGVTPSAVSHLMHTLRAASDDALLVKSGRGVVLTERARELAAQALPLLQALNALVAPSAFAPQHWCGVLHVAANDFQRELLLPAWLRRLRAQAPGVRLQVRASDVPSLALLRSAHCDLAISPRPPEGGDVRAQRLFADRHVVYYDPALRSAPTDLAQYLQADHVGVRYADGRAMALDDWLLAQGVQRRWAALLPGLGALAGFIRGSTWLASAPSLLARGPLAGLASAALPLNAPEMPMYLIWHERHHGDAAHRWARAQLLAVCADLLGHSPTAD